MKKKAVIALLATVLVFGATAQAEDAYDDGGILDPENPVTLTVWHYYNGVHQAAFDKLVEEFNGTVGKIWESMWKKPAKDLYQIWRVPFGMQ